MRPVTAPTVIAEGRLAVEMRATVAGVEWWVGEEHPGGLHHYQGVMPADLADAFGRALSAKADVSRALAAARTQPELPLQGDES